MIFVKAWTLFSTILGFILFPTPAGLLFFWIPLKIRLILIAPAWKTFSWICFNIGFRTKPLVIDERQEEFRSFKCVTGCLLIANHQSMLDIPLVYSVMPVPPIMKKEITYMPLIGQVCWISGSITVDRKDAESRNRAVETADRYLKEGIGIKIYPEGTRNKESDRPKDFSKIKAKLIKRAGELKVPVIPVSIYGTRKLLKNWRNTPVGVRFAPAQYLKENEDLEQFAERCWTEVQNGYSHLENQLA